MFTFGGDEEGSSIGSITVEGVVEVHDPVLGFCVRWRILDLGPLSNEVGHFLRLDGGPWHKFNCECAEFY